MEAEDEIEPGLGAAGRGCWIGASIGFSAADSIERGVGGMFGLKVGFVDLTISFTSHNGRGNSHDPMSSLKCTDFIVMSTIDTRARRILNDTPNFPGATKVTRPRDPLARRFCLLHIDSLIVLQS